MEFLYENGGTILVGMILSLVVVFNIKRLCRVKNTCGCDCENCVSRGVCHRYDK